MPLQEAAFNSLFPFGKNYLEGVSRSLLTSNIAVNSPWTSVDLQDKGGKFYGINQISSNIITIDRGKLKTPSGLILGTSGAGKGMATKHEIIPTKLKEEESDTEIIYHIALSYILGFNEDTKDIKHNFRQLDALPYAKEGTLQQKLDELFS